MPPPLKPICVAHAVSETVAAALADRQILSVGREALRIADTTGAPPCIVALHLVEACRRAQVVMELPTLGQLGPGLDEAWREFYAPGASVDEPDCQHQPVAGAWRRGAMIA
jgi:hypothetical protein